MKHFGLAINLKDDPEIIEKYKEYHSNVWARSPREPTHNRYYEDEHLSARSQDVHGNGNSR